MNDQPIISPSNWIFADIRDLWVRSACNTDVEVRRWLAEQKSIPTEVMRILAQDHDPTVRSRVAQNESCTIAMLKLLMADQSEDVRNAARLALFRAWKQGE